MSLLSYFDFSWCPIYAFTHGYTSWSGAVHTCLIGFLAGALLIRTLFKTARNSLIYRRWRGRVFHSCAVRHPADTTHAWPPMGNKRFLEDEDPSMNKYFLAQPENRARASADDLQADRRSSARNNSCCLRIVSCRLRSHRNQKRLRFSASGWRRFHEIRRTAILEPAEQIFGFGGFIYSALVLL